MQLSVVVVTADRPAYIKKCLDALQTQTVPPLEVIVVDGSVDRATGEVVAQTHPEARYVRSSIRNTPAQRNMGITLATGDIVAFIDDDAIAAPTWLEALANEYSADRIGGVGGFVESDQPSTSPPTVRSVAVGQILRSGRLVGNFDSDTGRTIKVDHVIGCNMSFRRAVLEQIGGFDPTYSGTCFGEETDVCARVRAADHDILFSPHARVLHFAAPRSGHSRDRYNLKFQDLPCPEHDVLLFAQLRTATPDLGICRPRYRNPSSRLRRSNRTHTGPDRRQYRRQGGGWDAGGGLAAAAPATAAAVTIRPDRPLGGSHRATAHLSRPPYRPAAVKSAPRRRYPPRWCRAAPQVAPLPAPVGRAAQEPRPAVVSQNHPVLLTRPHDLRGNPWAIRPGLDGLGLFRIRLRCEPTLSRRHLRSGTLQSHVGGHARSYPGTGGAGTGVPAQ